MVLAKQCRTLFHLQSGLFSLSEALSKGKAVDARVLTRKCRCRCRKVVIASQAG